MVREGRAEDALPVALDALGAVRGAAGGKTTAMALPALNAVAEIYVELGDAATAHDYFLQAVSLDADGQIPESQGGGAEKFLWLAQLSEEGGQDSVEWFERGAAVLRREIGALGEKGQGQEDEKRKKLAGALCGIIEVYMTDLSWDPTAETQCERLISEALFVAPQSAEPLQTLASIRISQTRIAEAKTALRDSMALWQDMPPEDDVAVPAYPTRVSLARLLMEVGMEEEALGVVERLVLEDDGSVEAWYLGGWCLYLLGGKQGQGQGREEEDGGDDVMEGVNGDTDAEEGKGDEDLHTQSMISSREWLRQSLKLYDMVEYEDERLRDHALELVGELDAMIGEGGEDEVDGAEEDEDEEEEEEDEEEEEWDGFGEEESEDSDEERRQEDEEMDDG